MVHDGVSCHKNSVYAVKIKTNTAILLIRKGTRLDYYLITVYLHFTKYFTKYSMYQK